MAPILLPHLWEGGLVLEGERSSSGLGTLIPLRVLPSQDHIKCKLTVFQTESRNSTPKYLLVWS